MSQIPLDETIDELIEALWTMAEKEKRLPTDLCEHVKVPFTDENIGMLIEKKYAEHSGEPTLQSLVLTEAGESRARQVIRRHRLTDVLLYHILNMKDIVTLQI